MKKRLLILPLLLFSLVIPMTGSTHNSVVVIPMGGEGGNISNVVTVAKSGGDFNSVLTAVNSINGASAENPYAIYLAPGEYDLADAQLTMKPYVSIFGSGTGVTILKSSRSGASQGEAACIVGADNAHLSNLTLNQTAAGLYVIALYNLNASPSISNLEIRQVGFGQTTIGIYNNGGHPDISATSVTIRDITHINYGIFNLFADTVMNDVSVDVSLGVSQNIAIRNDAGAPTLNNVRAKASSNTSSSLNVGLQCISSKHLHITGSTFEAKGSLNSYGLSIDSVSTTTQIINSKVVGGLDDGAAGPQCLLLYDENFTWLNC